MATNKGITTSAGAFVNSDTNNQANIRKTKNANNILRKYELLESRYNEYIFVMQYIYKCSSFEELFAKLYQTTLNYRQIVENNKMIAQDFYYFNLHGAPIRFKESMLIPDNTILIFLTPINRVSETFELSDLEEILITLQEQRNRVFIQNNLQCIDKDRSPLDLDLNNRHYEEYNIFKHAQVLYPGQYYYDLELGYPKKEVSIYKRGIKYFTEDKTPQEITIPDADGYDDILSNIISGAFLPEKYKQIVFEKSKTRYFVLKMCRSWDHLTSRSTSTSIRTSTRTMSTQNYIYENFMFYYNLIMANCKLSSIDKPVYYEAPFVRFSNFEHDLNFYDYLSKPKTIKKLQPIFTEYLSKNKKNIFNELKIFFPNYNQKLFDKTLSKIELYVDDKKKKIRHKFYHPY